MNKLKKIKCLKDDNKKMILEAQNMYNIHVSSNKILWMLFIYCYIDLGFKRFIYHQLYLKLSLEDKKGICEIFMGFL